MLSKPIDPELKPKDPLHVKYMKMIPMLNYQTPFDRSEYPCIIDTIHQTLKSFLWGFGPFAILRVLMSLKNSKNLSKGIGFFLKTFFSSKNIDKGLFAATFTLIFKATIIILRSYRKKDDGKEAILGGILAGYFSLFFIPKANFFALYMFVRGIDCILNSRVNAGKTKKHWAQLFIPYSLGCMIIIYGWFYNIRALSPAMKRYLDNIGIIEESDNFILAAQRQIWKNARILDNIIGK